MLKIIQMISSASAQIEASAYTIDLHCIGYLVCFFVSVEAAGDRLKTTIFVNGKPKIVPDYAKVSRPYRPFSFYFNTFDRCKASSSASLQLSPSSSPSSAQSRYICHDVRSSLMMCLVARNHSSHFEKNKIAFQEGAGVDEIIMDDDETQRESTSDTDEKHRSMEKV